MTYCYALKDTVLNERTIKLLVFEVLTFFFFLMPYVRLWIAYGGSPGGGCRADASWRGSTMGFVVPVAFRVLLMGCSGGGVGTPQLWARISASFLEPEVLVSR